MNRNLLRRIERMERIMRSNDDDAGSIRLIGETLVAERDRLMQEIPEGKEASPHRPEELGRLGEVWRQRIEAFEKSRRLQNRRRR